MLYPAGEGETVRDETSGDGPRFAVLEAMRPRLLEGRRRGESIRVWVPACGDGTEVYAIATVLLDALGDSAGGYGIRLYGTDADAVSIGAARLGRYPASIERRFSPERLDRFFIRVAGGYVVGPRVRDLAVFGTHDVTRDPPFSFIDLVSCPTLLATLNEAQRRSALGSIHGGLRPGGLLLVGSMQDVPDVRREAGLFACDDPANPLLWTKKSAARQSGSFRRHSRPDEGRRDPASIRRARDLGDRHLLEHYAPPSVVVDEKLRIVHGRGDLRSYLKPALAESGAPLLDAVHPSFRHDLAQALKSALAGEAICARAADSPIADAGAESGPAVTAEIHRLPVPAPGVGYWLIVFGALDGAAAAGEVAENPSASIEPGDLERELAEASAVLRRTIVELESSNEELDMANEELRVSNQELVRLNGALELSREELRSMAEELGSVNGELRHRLREVTEQREELASLLLHVRDVVIFVSPSGRIGHFTDAAARLLSLSPMDVGRGLDALGTFAGLDLDGLVTAMLHSRAPLSREAVGADGRVYVVTAEPPFALGDGAEAGVLLRIAERAEVPR